jgi:hypothetical protein
LPPSPKIQNNQKCLSLQIRKKNISLQISLLKKIKTNQPFHRVIIRKKKIRKKKMHLTSNPKEREYKLLPKRKKEKVSFSLLEILHKMKRKKKMIAYQRNNHFFLIKINKKEEKLTNLQS